MTYPKGWSDWKIEEEQTWWQRNRGEVGRIAIAILVAIALKAGIDFLPDAAAHILQGVVTYWAACFLVDLVRRA